MTKKYDLVVVGAGPAGLMAAKTAGENGLKVALLERKTDIPDLKRACAMMLVSLTDYYLGERLRLNTRDDYLCFPVNGFSVKYGGFYKNFYSWELYSPGGSSIALGNYAENSKMKDDGRISAIFDKEALLRSLLEEAKEKSVEIFPGANVASVEKTEGGVKVSGDGKDFEATFVIAADGRTSRITKMLGFNKERKFYQTSFSYGFDISGLDLPHPHSLINIFLGGNPPLWCFIVPKAVQEEMHFVFVSCLNPEADLVRAFDHLEAESKFSHWFRNAKRARGYCSAGNVYSPVLEPFKDNVLLVGDAGFGWEAECTGALMQGWKAANAITLAILDNNLNKEGVSSYLQWWQESYLEKHDFKKFFRISVMPYVLSEEDMDYLFPLVQEAVPTTFEAYSVPEKLSQAFEKVSPIIQKERPEILTKLQKLAAAPLEEILIENTKAGFPNR
jgi:digeranylgeranylglycerophospholipid reductase